MLRLLGPAAVAMVWGWLLGLRRPSLRQALTLSCGSVGMVLALAKLAGASLLPYEQRCLLLLTVVGLTWAMQHLLFSLLRSTRGVPSGSR